MGGSIALPRLQGLPCSRSWDWIEDPICFAISTMHAQGQFRELVDNLIENILPSWRNLFILDVVLNHFYLQSHHEPMRLHLVNRIRNHSADGYNNRFTYCDIESSEIRVSGAIVDPFITLRTPISDTYQQTRVYVVSVDKAPTQCA